MPKCQLVRHGITLVPLGHPLGLVTTERLSELGIHQVSSNRGFCVRVFVYVCVCM